MTLAEQAVRDFELATKTKSLTAIATKLGGKRNVTWQSTGVPIRFTFSDGSTLVIQGRGRNHTYKCE